MMSCLRFWKTFIVLGACAIAVMVALGAGRSAQITVLASDNSERVVPRVQIIQFGESIARFDTTTGEIHRFHGDLNKPNVRGQWVRHVRGVSSSTSGLLQLQKPRGVRGEEALFLVDAITGDTWLLRLRSAGADWDKVETLR